MQWVPQKSIAENNKHLFHKSVDLWFELGLTVAQLTLITGGQIAAGSAVLYMPLTLPRLAWAPSHGNGIGVTSHWPKSATSPNSEPS